MWQLLDLAAVRHIIETEPPRNRAYTTVPGNVADEGQVRRLVETVAQHLITLRQAYPDQFVRATMGADDSIRGALGTAADAPYGGGTILAGIRAWIDGAAAVRAPADAHGVTVSATAPRGTAQLVLEDDDGTPTVAALRLGNRPEGILGAAEGAHLTAFGLVVEGLKRAVEGAELDAVGGLVAGLIQTARGLATAGRSGALLGHAANRFAAADANATAALQALAAIGPADPAYVARVQDLIVAYLWLRNTLPLAAVTEGGVPAGKAEGRMLALLRAAEDGTRGGLDQDDADVLDALWGLLDSAALRSSWRPTPSSPRRASAIGPWTASSTGAPVTSSGPTSTRQLRRSRSASPRRGCARVPWSGTSWSAGCRGTTSGPRVTTTRRSR